MDENIGDEYKNYWETNMFYHTEELDSWGLDEAFYGSGGYYDSSSPDGAHSSSAASKNILLERNRRKKLNERLFALRAIVPNITKMDKASIIKDAIDYIEKLHDQERRIKSEILELESGKFIENNASFDFEEEALILSSSKKKKRRNDQSYDSKGSRTIYPIEDLEMKVCFMGEKTVVVSITCSKKRDTIVRLCEIFEALNLKIVTANITTTICGRLFQTLFIQTNEEEKEHLKRKIEIAIAAAQNDPEIPMST